MAFQSKPDLDWIARFNGGILSSAPFPQEPDTRFYGLTRFEIAISTPGWIRQGEAWRLLLQRVEDHDQAGVDVLVVVAGSPTSSDIAHPADELLVRAVIAQAEIEAVKTRYARRIWLHSWDSGAVYELVPGRKGAQRLVGGADG